MHKTRIVGLLMTLIAGVSHAGFVTLDTTRVLKLPIAKEGMTRIEIEDDAIESINIYPDDLKDQIAHERSGMLYVVAEGVEEPIYVGLVTRRGIAQDLKLIPTQKEARPILLKPKPDLPPKKTPQEEGGAYLKSFVQGVVPAGFYRIHIQEYDRGHPPVRATLKVAYQNTQYRILAFTVQNKGTCSATLDPRQFWGPQDLGVVVDTSQRQPDQSATIYVIQKI